MSFAVAHDDRQWGHADFAIPGFKYGMTTLGKSPFRLEPGFDRIPGMPFIQDIGRRSRYSIRSEKRPENSRLTESTGLEAILAANRSLLARYVRTRLRNDQAIEDVLQELWLKVQTVDSGPISEPLAYLYRMAENLVLDRKRAEQRRTARDHHWTEHRADGCNLSADTAPSPERIVVARDYLRRVDARLAKLPERTVFVFRAVRIDKRPQKELATELGISVSAVEKHLQRAYREVISVKEELEQDISEPQTRIAEGVGHDAG
jgi:RNA polymerase sigma-70 factor (ECF subfamily)